MRLRGPVLIVVAALLPLPSAGLELDQLAFLAGHWIGAHGEPYEEVWLEPRAGTIAGSFRWVFPGGRQVLEFLVIEETEEGVFLRFKHFGTDYVAWERDEPNTYKLTTVEGASATFERVSDHPNVPKILFYGREGDTLTFRGSSHDPADDPLVLVFTRK
jgi:hypothetical protein